MSGCDIYWRKQWVISVYHLCVWGEIRSLLPLSGERMLIDKDQTEGEDSQQQNGDYFWHSQLVPGHSDVQWRKLNRGRRVKVGSLQGGNTVKWRVSQPAPPLTPPLFPPLYPYHLHPFPCLSLTDINSVFHLNASVSLPINNFPLPPSTPISPFPLVDRSS